MYYFWYNSYMKKSVLIVDDSASWRKFHAASLNLISPKSYNMTFADCAREAIDIVREHKKEPFDIILSDLQMELDFEPDAAGEWFIKQVQTIDEYKNAKIILISAMYNIENIARNLNVDYLKKSTLVTSILPLKLKLEENR